MKRRYPTARNMALSVLAVLGMLFVGYLLVPSAPGGPAPPVEARQAAVYAATQVSWPVVFPEVPAGWRATSARLQGLPDGTSALHIGWVTSEDRYVALAQGAPRDGAWLRDLTGPDGAVGESVIGGQRWERYADEQGDRVLVARGEQGQTTVVYGTVEFAELEAFAGALRPVTAAQTSSTSAT